MSINPLCSHCTRPKSNCALSVTYQCFICKQFACIEHSIYDDGSNVHVCAFGGVIGACLEAYIAAQAA